MSIDEKGFDAALQVYGQQTGAYNEPAFLSAIKAYEAAKDAEPEAFTKARAEMLDGWKETQQPVEVRRFVQQLVSGLTFLGLEVSFPDHCPGEIRIINGIRHTQMRLPEREFSHPVKCAECNAEFDVGPKDLICHDCSLRMLPERESGNQPLEFRMDEDGELDEIVGTCDIHLERMAGNSWFLAVCRPGTQERAAITLHAKSQEIKPVISEPMPVEQGRRG